jgi:hypothetical protein
MNQWRTTGVAGWRESDGRAVYQVTKDSKSLCQQDHDELEALLNPWPSIESAPRDGAQIALRRGDRITTGKWLKWGDTRPDYDERGHCIGEVSQEPGAMWCVSDPTFLAEGEPTHWQPL